MTPRAFETPPLPMALGQMRKGWAGVIRAVVAHEASGGLPAAELERRLLELGFTEGTRVAVLHEGPMGRDPIAVRVHDCTIGLRRAEAMAVLVDPIA